MRQHASYWAFLAHRLSGIALAAFLPLHFWTLGNALSDSLAWTEAPLVKLGEWLIVVALAAHLGGGLRVLAQQFAGAWPYLQLIAGATGLPDPLDRRVVEAYWIGTPRLEQVGTRSVGDSMEDRFRYLTGARFPSITELFVPLRSELTETAPYTTSGSTAAVPIRSTNLEVMRFTVSAASSRQARAAIARCR